MNKKKLIYNLLDWSLPLLGGVAGFFLLDDTWYGPIIGVTGLILALLITYKLIKMRKDVEP